MRRVRKFFVGICGALCAMVCCTACRTATVAGQGQGLPDEAQRRFDYYYLEAVKHKLAGRYDDAFVLYKHCLDINPDAGEEPGSDPSGSGESDDPGGDPSTDPSQPGTDDPGTPGSSSSITTSTPTGEDGGGGAEIDPGT